MNSLEESMESRSTSLSESASKPASTGEKGKSSSSSLTTFSDSRLIQTYKIISGNALHDLETKVNYFLEQPGNEGYQAHGDIQIISYNDFVQTLVGYKYVA